MIAFHYASGSPYAWRVQLALEHKALAYEKKLLSFSAGDLKTPEFAALNPRRKVPVVVDGDFALYESSAILEYLDEAYPAQGARLFPGDARRRAVQRRVIAEVNSYFETAAAPLWDNAFGKQPEARDLAAVTAARETTRRELGFLAAGFAGDFFCGSEPGAADFSVYSILGFLRRAERRMPEVAFVELIGPQFESWMRRVEALSFYDECVPPTWKAG